MQDDSSASLPVPPDRIQNQLVASYVMNGRDAPEARRLAKLLLERLYLFLRETAFGIQTDFSHVRLRLPSETVRQHIPDILIPFGTVPGMDAVRHGRARIVRNSPFPRNRSAHDVRFQFPEVGITVPGSAVKVGIGEFHMTRSHRNDMILSFRSRTTETFLI